MVTLLYLVRRRRFKLQYEETQKPEVFISKRLPVETGLVATASASSTKRPLQTKAQPNFPSSYSDFSGDSLAPLASSPEQHPFSRTGVLRTSSSSAVIPLNPASTTVDTISATASASPVIMEEIQRLRDQVADLAIRVNESERPLATREAGGGRGDADAPPAYGA
jgi:RecA-family ATPase